MAKFHFKLQSVLRVRERARDLAGEQVALAQMAKEKLLAHIAEKQQHLKAQKTAAAQLSSGQVEPQKLLENQRYQTHILGEINTLESQVAQVESAIVQRRQILVEREKDVRSIELLKEKQEAEHQLGEQRAEQLKMDEWANFKFWQANQQ